MSSQSRKRGLSLFVPSRKRGLSLFVPLFVPQSIFNKEHLKMRILSAFMKLESSVHTIISFFHLKDTSYTMEPQSS